MMNRNLFKLLQLSTKNVSFNCTKLNFKFATFPSKEQMRFQKTMGYTGFQPNTAFRDDLYFPLENSVQRQGLEDLINHIKVNPNLAIEGRGLCTILYIIAREAKDEPFIFKELERHLYKFKENLSPRLSFGGLYASYKSNLASAYQVSFFEDEFTRNSQQINAYEAIEILQTMFENTTKVNEHKVQYFNQSVKPIIVANFNKQVRPYSGNLLKLFLGLRNMKIYDEELHELILKYLPYRRGLNNVRDIAEVYETLLEYKEKGLLKQNIDAHIEALEKKLTTKDDCRWRYNLKEKRFYTYDELVANRDNYTIQNQLNHKYRFSNPELIEKFNLVQSDKDAIKAELEARERSRELENLVLEMFELKNRGEVNQAEDKNTLKGTYENVIFVKEGEEAEEEATEEVDNEPAEEVDEGLDFDLKSNNKPKVKKDNKGQKQKNKSN
ncbi:hypothetical protein ABPG74_019203 [Tetrahymena malaccensis]